MAQDKGFFSKLINLDWKYVLLGLVIILLLIYGAIENEVHMRQPSEDWSIAVTLEEEVSQDYRMLSVIEREDNLGYTYAYVGDDGIYLRETNWRGEIEKELSFELPSIRVMVLKIDDHQGKYHIYYSDRKQLFKKTIDKTSYSIGEEVLVSNYSEQFDVKGGVVITSDDSLLQLIRDEKVIEEISGFEDVKKVLIKKYEDKYFFSYNTVIGGFLGVIEGEDVTTTMLQDQKNQSDFGYFSDMYIDNNEIVIMTNKVYMASTNPNLMRIYYLDKRDLSSKKEFNIYHSRTTLDPKIVHVEGSRISYVLGVQQTLDIYDELEKKYTWVQRGKYTNVSLYTRYDDQLLENTRLTITRRYPVGYDYFNGVQDGVLVWSDLSGDYGDLKMAGHGSEWIQYGRNSHKIRIVELGQTIVVGSVSAAIWGSVFHIFRIVPYWYIFIGYLILSILIYYLVKGNEDRKWKWLFLGFVLVTLAMKLYLNVIDNYDIVIYKNIYPMILGNKAYLIGSSVLSTLFAYLVYLLWLKDYSHSSKPLKIFFFVGVDYILYLLSVVIYTTTAMLVNSSLL